MQEETVHTFAQILFVMTAFFVAPAFGFAGLVLGARWIRPLARVMVPAIAVIAGLSFAGAIGTLLYPQYPYVGPPERHAAALSIAGHLSGGIALVWLARARRKEEPPPRVLKIAAAVVWLGATFVALTIAFASVAPPRMALPDEATHILERRSSEHLNSDYTYELEADMSPEAYGRYVERLDLPPGQGTTHELVVDDCGMRTTYTQGRMALESWCN